jgi:hypothetical protein
MVHKGKKVQNTGRTMILGLTACYHALIFTILALLWPAGEAFIVNKRLGRATCHQHSSNIFPSSTNNPIFSSIIHNDVRTTQLHLNLASPSSSLLTADLSETMTNVLIGIGGVVVVFGLVVAVFTLFVVPTAVKQVEELAKQYDPALWEEYEQKLRPGETLAQRPELLEELGVKVLELQRKANDESNPWEASRRAVSEAEVVSEIRNTPTTTSTDTGTGNSSIDVEVISKNKWDD